MASTNSDNLLRGLTKSQDERLKRVMQQVEHPTPSGTPIPGGDPASDGKHWALLTAESSGKYQWKLQDFVAGAWQDLSPAITSGSDYTAVEANGATGLTGSNVLLEFKGYDASGKPVYLFAMSGTIIAFTISANATGAGYYTGSELTKPTTLPDGTVDLVTSQFGSGASDLLIANLSEAGGKSNTGHDLTATTNTDHFAISGIGLYMGTNAAGKRVVLTDKQFVGCA